MADTPAQVAACPVPELGGGPASGSCLQPLAVSSPGAGMWQGCQASIPFTASVALFVMVVVQCGVNWVNERIVHY